VGEFAGLQPENRVREFVSRLAPPSEASLAREKAESMLLAHKWVEAEAIYRKLEEENQNEPSVLLGLIKALVAQGKSGEAQFLLSYFPASREFNMAQQIRPLADAMVKYEKNELPAETDLDTMFRNTIRLTIRGNHLAALDGLLDILRQDKRYRGDKARQTFLGILELLGSEDPDARQYRSELAMVLF
jgi:putative thioredoxin